MSRINLREGMCVQDKFTIMNARCLGLFQKCLADVLYRHPIHWKAGILRSAGQRLGIGG